MTVFSGCHGCIGESDPPQLTAATHTGAGTFSFLKNGQVWVPCSGFYSPEYPEATIDHHFLELTAYRGCDKPVQSIDIWVKLDSAYVGTYPVPLGAFDQSGKSQAYFYDTSYVYGTGIVHITFADSARHIISGDFSFEGKHADSTPVTISSGRFDLSPSWQ